MTKSNLAAELQRHLPWPVANAVALPREDGTSLKIVLDVSSDSRCLPRGYFTTTQYYTRAMWEQGWPVVAERIERTVNATLDLEASRQQKTPGALGTGGC